jgi:signal transduction histidine kinase/DNA-binding response OmpR family regulator/PAS domain-containing protein
MSRYVYSEELPLNARMMNLVYVVGFVTAAFATVTRLFIVSSVPLNITMIAITVLAGAQLYVSNRFNLHAVCGWVTLVVLCDLLFPITLFMLGGVQGGMAAYFVLSVVAIFLLAGGRAMFVLLVVHIVWVVACYYLTYRFPGLVSDLTVSQRYLDSVQSFIVAGLFIGVVIKFQERMYLAEKERAEEVSVALARRGEQMRVVNSMAALMLSSDSDRFEDALLRSLEMMAHCADVENVHIWKNQNEDGILYYTEIYDWEENGGLRTRENMRFSYRETLPAWELKLARGQCVNGVVGGFQGEELARLSPYGIVSILVIPVFLQNTFWGFVSFDDRRNERLFSKDDVDILQSGSLLLVNAIARNAMIEEMREADERTRAMLDATPVCCVLWSRELRAIDCNAAALKTFGVTDKLDYLDNFFDYSPELQPDGKNSRERARENIRRAFQEGRLSFEWMHQTRDGEQIPSEVTLVRVALGGEKILAGYIYDLREYKRMMNSLDERLEQQQLMSSISQSFISNEKMSSLINDALREMGEFLRVSRVLIVVSDESGSTRPVYVWVRSPDYAAQPSKPGLSGVLESAFPRTLPERGTVPSIACHDIRSDEKYAIFSGVGIRAFIWSPQYVDGKYWGMLSVEDCDGPRDWSASDAQLVGMISSTIAGAVARDIFEQERAKALEQAVKASKAKGDFLSNMSHEMRTPMNAIIGMTSIGKSAPDLERKDYAFAKIEDASTHLLGVINDILDMSKIEANKLELSSAEFNFEKMLQKVVNVVNFRVDEKSQNFSVTIDRAIPQTLIGDDQRLAQVITNLLSNAVKFTPEGGSIHLGAYLSDESDGMCSVRVEVRDTGIGITDEQQSRLFTSFEQADSGTSRRFGGTGLGLAISKRIVEMMGGEIWAESKYGEGSTFTFVVRAQRGKNARRLASPPGVNWGGLRVLAVDDAREILEYFREIASRFGLSCDTASSGEDACAMIERNGEYDIYFVDWKMPGMGGAGLARAIKERGAGKSVVTVISASEWSAIEDDARAAGVDKFLPKPLFPSAIADCINECLGVETQTPETDADDLLEVFEGRRVLLAEDVEVNREIVISLLEPTRIEIDCAGNGVEALRMFGARPDEYDMIFMDVQMPEMDGYEATRLIRELGAPEAKTVPIVAMTANVFKEDIEKCLAAGMNDHIGKPLSIEELAEKLRKYLK